MIRPSTWLSDETINAFMAALQLAHPHIKFFNTFFYSVLCGSAGRRSREGYNYEGVRRWTKKQTRSGIFEFESVVIPINKGNSHWCFAVICFKESRISFMDSLAGSTTFAKKVLQNLKRYLCDEWQEKVVSNQQQITLSNIRDIDSFELIEKVSGCPQQSDGSSCGVFVCYFAYCIARGEDVSRLPFNQKEADCFRKGIAYTLTLPLLILTSE
ncbi:hypothetical protein BDR26DRAFT_859226 [Obelidium mucronatum]|nr:hypothetical protein BDR26DRAFT_859226 [Obelidium mucronatum]